MVYYIPDRIVGASYIIIRFVILRIDPVVGRVFKYLSYISVSIIVKTLSWGGVPLPLIAVEKITSNNYPLHD